jgi:uncharacterized protein YbjT (DUF2867 family)
MVVPVMRVPVVRATGNIGSRTVAVLEREGHDVVRISRSLGMDLSTGDGLDAALAGVAAVVDATSSPPADQAATVALFGLATGNLLAAEQRAGVAHHVPLSIVGGDRIEGNAHYAEGGSRNASCRPAPYRGRSCAPPSFTTSPTMS